MISHEVIFFTVFVIAIVGILLFDLLFIGRKSHIISFKEAFFWTIVWIALSLGFYFLLRYWGDWLHDLKTIEDIQHKIVQYKHPIKIDGLSFEQALQVYRNNLSLEYLTGYLIEKALSVDNIFVMIMIFTAFNVREKYYKRVLFWGILGAVVMRFIFIFLSAALIQRFEWILYLFGLFLVFTGAKMFLSRNKHSTIDVQHHPVVRFSSKYFRVFPRYVGSRFFLRINHHTYITPLFIVLLVIEFMDVIFAVDSIPAIFSITKDPYLVFFSNIFAIIGLRALFFMIIHVINKFYLLKGGLAILLVFIGIKMLIHHWLDHLGFTTIHSLYVVLGIITFSIVGSLVFPKKEKGQLSLDL
ncbi:MAG: TerC/Alx family metal homeostasis membrane protein [Bacteroidales bacterium]